jgi:hypothetical protein
VLADEGVGRPPRRCSCRGLRGEEGGREEVRRATVIRYVQGLGYRVHMYSKIRRQSYSPGETRERSQPGNLNGIRFMIL